MSDERGTPTDAFFIFLAALVKAAPRDLPDEIYLRLADSSSSLEDKLREACMGHQSRPLPGPRPPLPDVIKLTLGGRTYEAVRIIKKGEFFVKGQVMSVRLKEFGSACGEEDAEWFLAHREEIPAELNREVRFVFPEWQVPRGRLNKICVIDFIPSSSDGSWYWGKKWKAGGWNEEDRPVRRVA